MVNKEVKKLKVNLKMEWNTGVIKNGMIMANLKKERIYNNGIKISTKKWDKEGNITVDIKH